MNTYAKIDRLTEPGSAELQQSFERLADALRAVPIAARMQARILECPGTKVWFLHSKADQCQLTDQPDEELDLEFITSAATWWEIAAGELSPVDAFLGGKMRVRGDTELGKELLRHLSHDGGSCDPCGA